MPQLATIIPIALIASAWAFYVRSAFTPTGVICAAWILFLAALAALAPDYYFSFFAGSLIALFLVAFFSGEFIVTLAKRRVQPGQQEVAKVMEARYGPLFEKRLRRAVILIGGISLLGSVAYIGIFVRHFGSLAGLLAAGWLIREEVGSGAIHVPLPVRAVTLLSYSAISLALIYWIRFRFRPFLVLPFLSVLIMGVAQAARAATFMVLIWAFIASYWRDYIQARSRVGARFAVRLVAFVGVILVIFVAGLMYREQDFTLDVDSMHQFRSFRTYAVGAVSAFSVFLDRFDFESDLTWGAYSFSSLFELLRLRKFAFGFYDEYLTISRISDDYTNIYTMFRSLIEDFGVIGAAMYMVALGAVSAAVYWKALRGSLAALACLCSLYAMFVYSGIAPMTQHNSIIVGCILPPVIIAYLSRESASPARTEKVGHPG